MSETLDEADITLVNLSLLLEQVSFDHKFVDDNKAIYVKDTGMFPFWIHVLPKESVLMLSTYFGIREEKAVDELKMLKFCNQINMDMILPSASWKNDCVWLCCPIFIKHKMLKSQFYKMMRFYTEGVDKVCRALKDHLDNQ